MLKWVRGEAAKSSFGIVISSLYFGDNRRQTFVMMGCKVSSLYKKHIQKLKHNDIKIRKYGRIFKLGEYHQVINVHI